MKMQLVIGRSGCGKTTYLYKDLIKEAVKNPDRLYIVVVPEQFTLDTQKQLSEMHPGKSLFNVDILSFDRLSQRILEEKGEAGRILLDDMAKNFIIRRLITERKKELKILGSHPDRMGFIDEIKSFITELEQYAVSPEDLKQVAEHSEKEALKLKLKDIATIYEAYRQFMSKGFMSIQSRMERASELAQESAMLKDATMIFDGFTGFTPIQVDFLKGMASTVKSARFSVTMDPSEDFVRVGKRDDLFYLSRKTIRTLYAFAEETGSFVDKPILIDNPKTTRFSSSPALSHLEKNIFSSTEVMQLKGENLKSLEISSAPTPGDELIYCARKICSLVSDEGYSFSDIAVVVGDMTGYSRTAPSVFDAYGIPLFVDETEGVAYDPFVQFVRAVIKMCAEDFSYDSVFAFLRNPFSGFETEKTDLLENHCLALGLKGYLSWEKPFEKNPLKLSKKKLEEVEKSRINFLDITGKIRIFSKSGKVKISEIIRLLYEYLIEMGADKKVREMCEKLSESGSEVRALRIRKIYTMVMKLFEKLDTFLGTEKVSPSEFAALFESGLKGASVGEVPLSGDVVVMGDIERSRLPQIKVLFLLGVNDGILPSNVQEGGIISEIERRTLEDSGFEIASSARNNILSQLFYIYLNLTKPSERLYLSYSGADNEGSALEKSAIVDSVVALYDGLEIHENPSADEIISFENPRGSFRAFATGLRKIFLGEKAPEGWEDLRAWYHSSEEFSDKIKKLEALILTEKKEASISEDRAKGLYGTSISCSVTRLEKFAGCAFSHFLKYGLNLRERKIWSLNPSDVGNIYHDAVERFMRSATSDGKRVSDLRPEEIAALSEVAMEDALQQAQDLPLSYSAGGRYIKERIRRVFHRATDVITYQIREGSFEPLWLERSFNIKAGNDGKVNLYGRIDRADVAHVRGNALVRVIDYKSYDKDFDIPGIYSGTSLQLMVYLQAAMEEIKRQFSSENVVAAGAYYYSMSDPFIGEDKLKNGKDADAVDKAIKKHLRLSGISAYDMDVPDATDNDLSNKKSSDVAHIRLNKEGYIIEDGSVTDEVTLLRYSSDAIKVAELDGKRILSGDAAISPLRLDTRYTSCTYCPYGSVCGFDEMGGVDRYRDKPAESRKMMEKLGILPDDNDEE